MRALIGDDGRRWGGRDFVQGRKLNLLVFGSRVILGVGTSKRTNRELETIAFELTTVGDRIPRGGVLVQDVNLFEGQTLGLKRDINFLITSGDKKARLTSGTQK